jgi:hypothetical protein
MEAVTQCAGRVGQQHVHETHGPADHADLREIDPSLSMDKQLRGYQKSQHIFHLLNLLNCYIIHLYLLKHSFND